MSKAPTANAGGLPAFASSAELLDRLRTRDKPAARHSLTPDGPSFTGIRSDHAKGNEMRIAELKRVLDDAHARLEINHSFSRLSGHASADFSKER